MATARTPDDSTKRPRGPLVVFVVYLLLVVAAYALPLGYVVWQTWSDGSDIGMWCTIGLLGAALLGGQLGLLFVPVEAMPIHQPGLDVTLTLWRMTRQPTRAEQVAALRYIQPRFAGTAGAAEIQRELAALHAP